jgi:hypothetical protein
MWRMSWCRSDFCVSEDGSVLVYTQPDDGSAIPSNGWPSERYAITKLALDRELARRKLLEWIFDLHVVTGMDMRIRLRMHQVVRQHLATVSYTFGTPTPLLRLGLEATPLEAT